MNTKNEYRRDIELLAGWWVLGPYGRFVLGYKHDVTGVISNIREVLQNADSGYQNDGKLQECTLLLKKVRTAVLQHEGGINCNDREKQESIALINSFIDEIEDLKTIWAENPSSVNTANDGMVKQAGKPTGRPKAQIIDFKEYLECSDEDKSKIIWILKDTFKNHKAVGVVAVIMALLEKKYFKSSKPDKGLFGSLRLVIGEHICTDQNFRGHFNNSGNKDQIKTILNKLP